MNSETDAEKDRLLENVSSSLAQLGLPRPQLRSSAIAHACTHTSMHAHMHALTLTGTLSPTWRRARRMVYVCVVFTLSLG